jgi:hypothetical protein
MNEITERLREEISALDLGLLYEERVCMWEVSKYLQGNFTIGEREERECGDPLCVTIKAMVEFKIEATPHPPCDASPSRAFDGLICGKMLCTYSHNGSDRGYHWGKFEWHGSASRLVGTMSGVTNVGAHRGREPCEQGGHMEGRLDAIVVDGKHEGCRVLATYAIDLKSHGAQNASVDGVLEGVTIYPCESCVECRATSW